MKKLLLLFIVLFSFQLKSQTATSSCTAPDSIVKKYKKDAERLALRREYHVNSTYTDSVVIDHSLTSNYLSALLAVYNATALPARDTVVAMFNLHTNPVPEMNVLLVNANQGNAWMQSLQNSVIPTGYAPIDNLIAHYDLQEQAYYQSTQYDVVVFKRDSSSNLPVIASQFTAEPTVLGSAPSVNYNDMKNISDSVNSAFTNLSYTYGWGTCADGCDFHSTWTFQVYPDCIVKYLGHSGDNLVFTGIKENQTALYHVLLYPNPASEKLYVKFTAPEEKPMDLDILNAIGQTLIHKSLSNVTEQQVDVSSLPSGIYFVRLKSEIGERTVKLVKE